MATDKQSTRPATDENPQTTGNPQSGTTQIGQVIRELGNITRRLPNSRPRRARAPARNVSRERVDGLMLALGDPQHPDHADAVEQLVELGSTAVPALTSVLSAEGPWLEVYRAAEALGRIADPRAVGPLIQALQHPNSNVRWSIVRALTQIDDVRALIELRRVAQKDQGRTTWGETVAGTAQAALDQMRSRSIWGQSLELVKTAVISILMIVSLIVAYSVITTLRSELDSFGRFDPAAAAVVRSPLATPTAAPAPTTSPGVPAAAAGAATGTTEPEPTLEPIQVATQPTGTDVVGTVLQDSNVRPFPGIDNTPIGRLARDAEVIFVGQNENGSWYLVQLAGSNDGNSVINSADGSGWVSAQLLTPPAGDVPVVSPEAPPEVPAQPEPTPELLPLPSPTPVF